MASFAVSAAFASLSAQAALDTVQIRTVQVSGNVYMLMGAGGNIGLSVGADAPFVVDDQFAPLTPRIIAAIAQLTDKPVRFVINTHWHGDHTGGNENFGKAGALIVAHENVRRRVNPGEFREVMGNTRQDPPDALPVVTFNDRVTFYWNGETIHVMHLPAAHTDGDAVIHFMNANVLHMGDLFFNGSYPFVDVQSGGDVDGVVAAADMALSHVNPSTKIIPGHGPLATPADLRRYRDMVATVRDRVAALKAEGKTEDQVVAARPSAEFDAAWSGGQAARIERFVRAVYVSVGPR
jgi:glyoxylase-like metal-dependent hydrolase (beta-lactamase superfamily II)